MSFVNGKAIALATEHVLTMSANILEERTKNDGANPMGVADGYTWGVSCNSLVGFHENGNVEASIVDLAKEMLGLRQVDLVFDSVANPGGASPSIGFKPSGGVDYNAKSGKAWIESLNITAGPTGYASASVSFKGEGFITDLASGVSESSAEE